MSLVIRLTQAGAREAILQDYIKFARAKGLTERRVVGVHLLKNILIPVVTVIGLEFGNLVAFSVVTETIFAWPGMGKLLITSIQSLDRPVIVAYLVIIVLHVRAHQSRGRHPLLAARSARAAGGEAAHELQQTNACGSLPLPTRAEERPVVSAAPEASPVPPLPRPPIVESRMRHDRARGAADHRRAGASWRRGSRRRTPTISPASTSWTAASRPAARA